MQSVLRQSARPMIALLLVTLFLIPADLRAQNHVVSSSDLQKQVMSSSQQRQHNLEALQNFLSTPLAEKAMKDANVSAQQVRTAVSTLSNDDLSRLSARADKAQKDFAAGDLSQRDLILIILAVVVLVLIIVAVR
ncbi:MAG TPA: PA2779 family protein [Candidatus Angelobacter sp.]